MHIFIPKMREDFQKYNIHVNFERVEQFSHNIIYSYTSTQYFSVIFDFSVILSVRD